MLTGFSRFLLIFFSFSGNNHQSWGKLLYWHFFESNRLNSYEKQQEIDEKVNECIENLKASVPDRKDMSNDMGNLLKICKSLISDESDPKNEEYVNQDVDNADDDE